jgi:putative ABC transport system permease protein
MFKHYSYNFFIALEAITHNKLRGILTSLGIVFGVASVISMLAIGRGAQQEILEQMKLLGTNNIVITPIVKQEEGKVTAEEDIKKEEKKRFTPGLTLVDARSIAESVPFVEFVSPEVVVETVVLREGLKRSAKLVGVDTVFFRTTDFEFYEGTSFISAHMEYYAPVCVIGYGIKTKFFARDDPIGKTLKCGHLWLKVIGVLKERKISKESIQRLGIRNVNMDVYTPINTLLLRYKNRTLITKTDIQQAARSSGDDQNNQEQKKTVNYHQLDRLVVRVSNSGYMTTIAEIINRMLERRHNKVIDYEITVPENLLKQEQRTKEIFNVVLGAIASISLLVGGIGIMNIMLASVLERTKEIGIRRAIGATKSDVIIQFLSEAVTISVTGGIIGVIVGIGSSYGIEKFSGILTIVSPLSVLVSFGISISIGIAFGIFPARRASEHDPIVALRYE